MHMSSQVRAVSAKRRPQKRPAPQTAPAREVRLSPARGIAIPLTFAAVVAALGFVPQFAEASIARWSCWGAASVLLFWGTALLAISARRHRTLLLEISVRKQHYIQACAHLTIYTYWGAYWNGVHDAALLIAAQLAFAYAFDCLLSWTRRDVYTLGF